MMAYIKRHDVPALLSSHYRWLITTFWWWLFAWGIVIGADALRDRSQRDRNRRRRALWTVFQHSVGTDRHGRPRRVRLGIIWLWVIYRLVRGAIRLSDGSAAP